jgi:SAM-dependent methyltransferase
MLSLSEIAANLEQGTNGIWSVRKVSKVSYPDEGNASCLAIEDTSFWFRHRNNCILEVIKQLPPATPFFDVGGGNGYVAKALQDAGLEVVVVEPGSTGALSARRRGVQHVIHASLEDAGFLPGVLPSVGLFDVLEHVEDDFAYIRSIRNYLRPGGTVYITVPAFEWLWSQEDVFAGHYRRYTRRSLSRVLKEAGLQVKFVTCFFSILPLPILIFRSLPHRLRLHKASPTPDALHKDHQIRSPLGGRVLNFMLQRELERIKARSEISFGGSCLAVATKA